jgi:CheY-like chemotaxis protein
MGFERRNTATVLARLRACVLKGAPEWLLPTINMCLLELEGLVFTENPEHSAKWPALRAQAETLIAVLDAYHQPGEGGMGRILIVEDDAAIREALKQVLEEEGHEVLTAENGQQGLDILREQRGTVLVLLDLLMPVMNGWQFRAEQQRHAVLANHPVIVMSATRNLVNSDIEADAMLAKPIDLEVLLETVRQHLAK